MNEREIFAAALQQPDSARAAFLASACRGNVALRERVAALLREQEQLGSFLEASPAAALASTVDQASIEKLGEKVGPYKLLQQIGEGGMGAVYLAEQTAPVVRRVALKIIKPGMDTRQVIARFEAERQALALMDHPHIAKVLDAGTTDTGRPFFVMELVKGVPITQYCDQQHLTLRERLELFLPICQAIQHAHQKGIIHRDIKPSNVLIAMYDGVPVPKVIDFGVAKATSQRLTEKTMFTEVGSIVGTLEYMAPEQAELNNLDIDTRADIYSLGVLLYELLTGSTPFSAKKLRSVAFDEMLRVIREEEPQRPSTKLSSSHELPSIAANRKLEPQRLTKLVQGDLDWIVMKCLEKQRQRRYETANGLALDLGRYLHDEPVLACPPSAAYQLRKYLRRHRGLVTAGGAIALAVLLGAIGTTAGLMRAAWESSAKEEARHNAATSDQLAKAATKAEGDAKAALARAIVAERDEQIATHLSRARAFRTSGREGQRLRCLDELAQAARLGPPPPMQMELRNEAIAALTLFDVARAERLVSVADPKGAGKTAGKKTAKIEGKDVVISTAAGMQLQSLKHPQQVQQFAWRTDEKFIATLCDDMNVYVWHVESGELISVLIGHNAYRMTFSPSGEVLIVHSYDGMCRLWDAIRGQVLLTIKGILPGEFTADEQFLANGQSAIQVFGNRECRLLRHGEFGNRGRVTRGNPSVYQIEFSSDSKLMASAATDGVRVWDLSRDGVEIAYLPDEIGISAVFLKNNDLCTSNLASLGRWRFAAASGDGSRQHWGTRETLVDALPGKIIKGIAVTTADQRILASIEYDGAATDGAATDSTSLPAGTGDAVLVDLDDPAKTRRIGRQEKCWLTAVSPDGQWIAISSWAWAPPIPAQVFRLDTGARAAVIADNSYVTLRFSRDSQWLMCGGQSRYDLRQAGTWKIARSFERRSHLPGPMDISPDGKYAAICPSEEEAQIVRLEDYQPVATLRPPDGQVLAAGTRFSPDGRFLATNTSYGRIFLWDLQALRQSLAVAGLDWNDSRQQSAEQPALPAVAQRPAPPPLNAGPQELVKHYSQLLASDPADVDALRKRATAYRMTNQRESALADYRAGLRLHPDDPDFLCQVALLCLDTKQETEALDLGRKLIKTEPGAFAADQIAGFCHTLASFLIYGGPWSKTAQMLGIELDERAVKLAPQNADYLRSLGIAYCRTQRWEEGFGTLTKSQALSGTEPDWMTLSYLVNAKVKLGDRPQAEKYFQQLEAWGTTNASTLNESLRRNFDLTLTQAKAALFAPVWQLPADSQPQAIVDFLSKIIAKDPEDCEALLQRAENLRKLGQYAQARDDLRAILKSRPAHAMALLLTAQVELQQNRLEPALEATRLLLNTPREQLFIDSQLFQSSFLSTKANVVDTLLNTGQPTAQQAAIELAERAAALLPKNWVAYATLAQTYGRVKRWDEAARVLNLALENSTGTPSFTLWRDLAIAEHHRGNQAAAKGYLDRLQQWGREHQSELKTENARSYYQRVLWQATTELQSPIWQAPANATPQARVEFYTQILAQDPDDVEAALGRSQAYMSLGDHAAALSDLEAGLKRKPDHSRILLNLAILQHILKHPDDSMAAARRLIAIEPETLNRPAAAGICHNLCNFFLNTKDQRYQQLAAELARRAVALQPENWLFRQTCGIALYRAGRWGEAVSELEAGNNLSKAPTYNNLLYLAMAEQRRGNTAKAQEYLESGRKWASEHGAELEPLMQNHVKSLLTETEAVLKEPPTNPGQK